MIYSYSDILYLGKFDHEKSQPSPGIVVVVNHPLLWPKKGLVKYSNLPGFNWGKFTGDELESISLVDFMFFIYVISYHVIPIVRRQAVAEVSKIGNL